MSMPGRYQDRKAAVTSLLSMGASAFSVNDGSVVSPVVAGYQSSWNVRFGPPASRARCAITAEMLPPAESPATAMRAGSPPSSAACAATHCSAAQESSIPAGNGCSGASRYSIDTTMARAPMAWARATWSCESRSPIAQPPPW